MRKKFKQLTTELKRNHPSVDLKSVKKAYQLAQKIHQNQKRLSGQPLLAHLLAVAQLTAEIRLEEDSVVAALLHESIRQGNLTKKDLEEEFGAKVAVYVENLTKLSETPLVPGEANLAENLKKIFLLFAQALPVALIRLADRVDNIQTIHCLPVKDQAWAGQKALNFYAPVASILGVYHFQWQLEDAALAVLRPEAFQAIVSQLTLDRQEMDQAIETMKRRLLKELAKEKIRPEKIFGRTKSIYSIWKKLKRYQKEGKVKDLAASRIYDQMALMILVKEVSECYQVLGVVNKLVSPLSGSFDDYVAHPKANGYRSLHTAVKDDKKRIFEIQIRTSQMHEENEFGQAAHFYYKKRGVKSAPLKETDWIKRLQDWSQTSAEEIFSEKVFVFTPKGDVYELPEGATPVDFAYKIHTDLGNGCGGAKVDGRMVALDYQLESGQTVEVIAQKNRKAPSRDWLKFVKTRQAKETIRRNLRE